MNQLLAMQLDYVFRCKPCVLAEVTQHIQLFIKMKLMARPIKAKKLRQEINSCISV